METIYGESAEIQVNDGYSNGGGIALYSADDSGTISGGSNDEGSVQTSARIYWTITRTEGPEGFQYTGGITGVSWFTEIPQSPFAVSPYNDPATIWDIASRDNNLNEVFNAWNADQTDAGTAKRSYFMYYLSVNAQGCSSNQVG